MRILGAILAGGQSRRFGSDKAAAIVDGKPLIEQVASRLRPQVEELVVVGKHWPGLDYVPDLPVAGLGPIGGLAGALAHAKQLGFDAVLSSGCDLPDLPSDLSAQLSDGPAIVADMPIVGLWSAGLADLAIAWLADPANRSAYRFADHVGARRVTLRLPLANINSVKDLPKAPLAQTPGTD